MGIRLAALMLLIVVPSSGLSQEWVRCAQEGQTCRFGGVKIVRYGTPDRFQLGTFTDSVACASSVFGDPVRGVPKFCWVYHTASEASEHAQLASRHVERLQRELREREETIRELRTEVEIRGERIDELVDHVSRLERRLERRDPRFR